MQLIILFFISLNLFPSLDNNQDGIEKTIIPDEKTVEIEIINEDDISFFFSIKHEQRRNILKIRSEQSIKSMRTVDKTTNAHKGYDVAGSDLIIIPLKGFDNGIHLAEIRFQDIETVVQARFDISEQSVVLE